MFLESIVLLSDFSNSNQSVFIHFLKSSFFSQQSSPQVIIHSINNLIDIYFYKNSAWSSDYFIQNSKSTTHFLINFNQINPKLRISHFDHSPISIRTPSLEQYREKFPFTTPFPDCLVIWLSLVQDTSKSRSLLLVIT